MSRLLIHVEGETEETFVNEVLAPHLYQFGYSSVSARLLGNSRRRSKRGRIGAWHAVRSDILNHLREDPESLSTIMVDYYALPQSGQNSWPMRKESTRHPFLDKPAIIQNAIHKEISESMGSSFLPDRFIPYIMMYEFEGLLFSNPENFAKGIGQCALVRDFQKIRASFETPEHINDSPETAPSKRIIKIVSNYDKPLMGTLAILEIGLDQIRAECALFNHWMNQLENGCTKLKVRL